MNRRITRYASAALGLLAALSACSGRAPNAIDDAQPPAVAADFTLKSAALTLPEERPVLPATANGDLLTQNCSGCHSAEMLASQPPLDSAKWQAEIDKMRKVFHAPVSESDDAALVIALSELQHTPAR
ncbi:MAG: cytochrome C nitrite reductase [Sphingomonas sp.]